MKINLLGGGRVGSFIAKELKKEGFQVTVYDNSNENLKIIEENGINARKCDLSIHQNLKEAIKNSNLIINALPGFLGFKVLEAAIEEGISIIDVSFMPENPLELDKKAKENKVFAIVDAGIAPGLSNFLVGREEEVERELNVAKIYVGGIPFERTLPFQYKAPFSPQDVLEEYLRDARYKINGKIETSPALSDLEEIYIPGIGTLEAFLTDGLRTLLWTTKIPTLIEKTLRYPGHCNAIKILKNSGFLSKEPIEIKGIKISPIEFSSKILFPLWELKKEDREMTILYLYFLFKKNGSLKEKSYFLIETTDVKENISSMARTTGTPAIIFAKMVLEGKIKKKGILPPEIIAKDEKIFEYFIENLEKRGIRLISY